MHLWQIRHIPNRPQTLRKMTFAVSTFLLAAVSLLPQTSFVAGQTGDGTVVKAGTDGKPSPAAEFLDRVRQELPKHQTIKADLAQMVSIGDQQFKVVGQYLSSRQNSGETKLRLSYTVTPDQGARGEMLEVCDGTELWTMLTLSDSKRVTHRNVKQILKAAVEADRRSASESTLRVELGLGGLTALMASLERTMVFDAMKQEESEGHQRTIIQGRWKKELVQRFPKEKDDSLPPFVPDLVRLYVNTQTLFPERLLYLTKQPEKKTFKPLVSLEFHNVEFDGPIDEKSFVFEVPEDDDIVPEDVTKMYLDRLTAPGDAAPPRR